VLLAYPDWFLLSLCCLIHVQTLLYFQSFALVQVSNLILKQGKDCCLHMQVFFLLWHNMMLLFIIYYSLCVPLPFPKGTRNCYQMKWRLLWLKFKILLLKKSGQVAICFVVIVCCCNICPCF
jgi:hypothetical protein